MSLGEPDFREESAQVRTASVALSHVSVEIGHLYTADYERSDDEVAEYFRRIARWLAAVREVSAAELPDGVKPRISTCFLIDDYYGRLAPPDELVPRILLLAKQSGLEIDYLARESAMACTDETAGAELVRARLVSEPIPGDDGSRPSASQTGWLANGQRSAPDVTAMTGQRLWSPPKENAEAAHSIFTDIEMWSDDKRGRRWACPFLASVWQLTRLALLRDGGSEVFPPQTFPAALPSEWSRLPAVFKVNPKATGFAAYRTTSIMDGRFVRVENAVRSIVGSVAPQASVTEQLMRRAAAEGLRLPDEAVDRIDYVFMSRTAW